MLVDSPLPVIRALLFVVTAAIVAIPALPPRRLPAVLHAQP